MEGMDYELLIRRVFNCDRGEYGAEAAFFNSLAEDNANAKADAEAKNNGELQYRLGLKTGKVVAHLSTALHVIKNRNSKNEEFTSGIDTCLSYLYEPSFENIERCIGEAGDLFKAIGLRG